MDAAGALADELEFVQMLAKPACIYYLAHKDFTEDPAFINYLEYLEYWRTPPYIQYVARPQCLTYLRLLRNPEFVDFARTTTLKQFSEILDSFYVNDPRFAGFIRERQRAFSEARADK
eukprot:gnl/Chilomastix_cuspidata/5143.p1 GENE.gnl/Chilomastix_cuspidata/5143~~gnl/Chilomastix_cuspidata/5143.p1  ORF type:complete len:130 (+),score=36.03 gnl/Chilomastix_cuspidata/5143:37-390(+)